MDTRVTIAAGLLAEFEHEAANTRRMLDRVPEDRLEWSPHPKSMTTGRLATHLALVPRTGVRILSVDTFDIADPNNARLRPAQITSHAGLLQFFDANVAALVEALRPTSDAHLHGLYTFRRGEQIIFTLPRVAALRAQVLNHSIHHRAQLGVYLRLLDIPVPGMYGPSADE